MVTKNEMVTFVVLSLRKAKCFKIKSCLRKTTKVFVLNTRLCEELSIFHLFSSRGLFSKL